MIDKTKKYKLLGLTFAWDEGQGPWVWRGLDGDGVDRMALGGAEMAYQIEQGNAEEVFEPREFKTTGWHSIDFGGPYIVVDGSLPDWAMASGVPLNTFEVTIRQVQK